mmetsp:Transcript_25178/g.25387  ORF Transcript_25178/g.25387 Transcript_25178/m.25387 type:complete len:123 (+) Transcript_25178:71-439(+)
MATSTNLFRIVNGLRYFGVGCKLVRNTFTYPDTYWIVTRVKLSTDQNHGRAWGRLVWRGRPKPYIQKIGPARKKGWTLLKFPDYHKFSGNANMIECLSEEGIRVKSHDNSFNIENEKGIITE